MPARDIDEYLQGVDEPARTTLEALRRTITEVIPDAEEYISYGMPAFRLRGTVVAGFAAFKKHLSYLPHSGSILEQLGDELEGYERTPGSLHFALDEPLPRALVERLIELRIAQAEQR
ncbi:MAG: DUF1801 domain-containing protein [Dehalococcoidia bacterium]